jgi:hypothetical protein
MRRRVRTSLSQVLTLAVVTATACTPDLTEVTLPEDLAPEPQATVLSSSSAYSASSPHWRHMRTATSDYRIHTILSLTQKAAEWDWAARHFDVAVGGWMNEYKRRNPTLRHYTYDLIWAPMQKSTPEMEKWLTANGYVAENSFLHKAGTSRTKANRIAIHIWASDRYLTNPKNPGFRAWRAHRTKSLTALNASGRRSDGLLFDELGTGAFEKHIPWPNYEFASRDAYYTAFRSLMAQHRQNVPGGVVLLNQAQRFSKTEDKAQALHAGGSLTEYVNSPYFNQKWNHVDELVAGGGTVAFYTGVSPTTKGTVRYNINPGNYGSIAQRVLMWEYASYLMVVEPTRMDAVYFMPYGLGWSVPMPTVWLTAFEYDIGLATGKRSIFKTGTDGAGQPYQVFRRNFQNGMVLIRPQAGSGQVQYGDASGITVTLPAGTWYRLRPDGSKTAAVTSVRLRLGEAVIVVK